MVHMINGRFDHFRSNGMKFRVRARKNVYVKKFDKISDVSFMGDYAPQRKRCPR